MGMDVYGRKPKSKDGEYFRNNVWWWRPLWDYCCLVAPKIIGPDLRKDGHFNGGAGLLAKKALALADVLTLELESGRCAAHAKAYQAHLDAIPDETCNYCKGTGKREGAIWGEPGTLHECNGCEGKGKRRPSATWYPFSVENVREFTAFLVASGGFKIL